MHTAAYPYYGTGRPGPNQYITAGFGWGAYRGLGQNETAPTVSTAPAIVPKTREDYVAALRRQSAELQLTAVIAATTGSMSASEITAMQNAAASLEAQANAIEAGTADPPPEAYDTTEPNGAPAPPAAAAPAPPGMGGLLGAGVLLLGGALLLGALGGRRR